MSLSPWPILLLALITVLFALDRLLLWMERKGWIYYRKNKSRSTGRAAVRGVLSTFEEIARCEIRYVKEDQRQRQRQSQSKNQRG